MQKTVSVTQKNIRGQHSPKQSFLSWSRSVLTNEYVFVLCAAFILLIPNALLTGQLSFRLDTDYNVVLPMAQFAIRAFTDPGHFLEWNPQIGLGVPVLGDPSSLALSPWYMPFLLLFGADLGLRIIIAVSVIVSGLSMVRLLRSFNLHPWVIIWGSVLYELSGSMGAMFAAGHIERFASYAVTPLAVLFMWKKKLSIADCFGLGLLFTGMYLSDDFYTPWFLALFMAGSFAYMCICERKKLTLIFRETGIITAVFITFSLVKLIPFIRDVLPHFNRLTYINPYEGSVHGVLLPLFYIVPWQVTFYDRPFFQRLLNFRYNWYEYYAFISPFAFLPFLYIRSVFSNRHIRLALILILIGTLYLSLNYQYSPFYWLFRYVPFFRTFRVPQRIGVPLLVPVLVITGFCADFVLKKVRTIPRTAVLTVFILSCVWTGGIFFSTLHGTFEKPRVNEKYVAGELRKRDSGNFFVASFVCCIQPFFLTESIPVLNYYYGWIPTYAPQFTNLRRDTYDFSQFKVWRPSYIISRTGISFFDYGYYPYFDSVDIVVWKTNYPNIFPKLSAL